MDYIRYEAREMIGQITVDRPKALNVLSCAVLDELAAALDGVDITSVRALVITGAGEKAFVAGADVAEMCGLSQTEAIAFSQRGNGLMLRLERFPIPTIAAVNGYAFGGGCELAMSCDIRLCADTAVFGLPELGLGITPGFGGTQRLARIVGMSRAKELLFTARNVPAEEALRIGLVSAVYARDQLMVEAMKLAARIAQNAPIAVQAAKRAMQEGIEQGMERAVETEAALFGGCFESEDQRGAMQAFLEKRKPEAFRGR